MTIERKKPRLKRNAGKIIFVPVKIKSFGKLIHIYIIIIVSIKKIKVSINKCVVFQIIIIIIFLSLKHAYTILKIDIKMDR